MSIPPKNLPADAVPHSTTSADEGPVENSSMSIITTELPCPLLELSAELRNKIWETYYYDVALKGSSTNLLAATDPSSALLSTCRQVKAEASGFFKAAKLRFWKKTCFTFDLEMFYSRRS
ncbi:hypothetical protein TI39_contig390g00009 [Zymoseptoria brevis]|uniref:Uncharacterized protein n=1 Tax=Zymoseptoria brevis TaxID=1047168 RepID=A0A0F4GN28_9PEZI|nr:hypothetical protein TI39_contig390g00009 [Zymoseptoria brevis]